jgi:biotin operon repressor
MAFTETWKEGGFVLMYRKSLESRVFQNPFLWKVWSWCLLKASFKENWFPIDVGQGVSEVHLGPGQFIFGRKVATRELKMPPSTVWKRMQKLRSMGNLDINSGSHYSIVTLCNWNKYQTPPKEIGQPIDQQRNSHRAAMERPKDTYNNNNNANNEKNKEGTISSNSNNDYPIDLVD